MTITIAEAGYDIEALGLSRALPRGVTLELPAGSAENAKDIIIGPGHWIKAYVITLSKSNARATIIIEPVTRRGGAAMTARRQKGYALTDALIAAAIAAGVAVTAAQSLGVAARSAKSAKDLSAVISEAETINARIDAGLENNALLEGFSGMGN